MEKKLLTPEEKQIEWLKNEMEKDNMQLDKEKQEIIESLKHLKKEEIKSEVKSEVKKGAKTPAERQRERRERLKNQLGEEELKKQNQKKMKE